MNLVAPVGQRIGLGGVRPSPFVLDLVFTAATSAVTGLATLLVARIVASSLGPHEFGAFAIARQLIAITTPVSTLAMGVALARYVAVVREDDESRRRYLLAGIVLSSSSLVLLLALAMLFDGSLARWFFHEEGREELFKAALLWIASYSLLELLTGYFRGWGRINLANAWKLALVGVGPALAALLIAPRGQLAPLVLSIGALSLLATLPVLGFLSLRGPLSVAIGKGHISRLARYGVPRVPGGLALAGILGVGLVIAARLGSARDSGVLAVGLTALALAETAIAPFSILVLPRVARLHARGDYDFLRSRIGDAVGFVFDIGLFATVQGIVWAEAIVLTWLGDGYRDSVAPMRVLLSSLIPFLGYIVLRSVVDGVDDRPVNTWNLLLCFFLTCVCSVALASTLGVIGVAGGSAVGILVLGYRTFAYLRSAAWLRTVPSRLGESLLLNVLAGGIAMLLRWLVGSRAPGVQLATGATGAALMLIGYMFCLDRMQVGWVREAKARVFPSSSGTGGPQ